MARMVPCLSWLSFKHPGHPDSNHAFLNSRLYARRMPPKFRSKPPGGEAAQLVLEAGTLGTGLEAESLKKGLRHSGEMVTA